MDVSFLEPVFAAHGPFATVCADVRHTSGSAAAELELRVRAHRERLTGEGAPDDVVEAVRARLRRRRPPLHRRLHAVGLTPRSRSASHE